MQSFLSSLGLLTASVASLATCGGYADTRQQVAPSQVDRSENDAADARARGPTTAIKRDDSTASHGATTSSNTFTGPEYPFELGIYVHTHVAFSECGKVDPCEVEVVDRLAIRAGADGALDIEVVVSQDNGHMCNFAGHLAEISYGHWGWADESQQCRVEIRLDDSSLNLTSDGCRETYCGARAYLLATFDLSELQQTEP